MYKSIEKKVPTQTQIFNAWKSAICSASETMSPVVADEMRSQCELDTRLPSDLSTVAQQSQLIFVSLVP